MPAGAYYLFDMADRLPHVSESELELGQRRLHCNITYHHNAEFLHYRHHQPEQLYYLKLSIFASSDLQVLVPVTISIYCHPPSLCPRHRALSVSKAVLEAQLGPLRLGLIMWARHASYENSLR